MVAGDRKKWWPELKTVAKRINETLDAFDFFFFLVLFGRSLFLCCPTLVIVGNFSDEITLPSVMIVLENKF